MKENARLAADSRSDKILISVIHSAENAIKVDKLYRCITELNKHGHYAINQAKQLSELVNRFVEVRKQSATSKDLLVIREEFKYKLQENYRKMGRHSQLWGLMLDNISMEATAVGLGSSFAKTMLQARTGFFAPKNLDKNVQRSEQKTQSDQTRPSKPWK
ncbi:MAG: hypothetical protein QM652_06860 [Legionella sp.]|uniref:hypothetical protein n=1 Tax=Legionella sp. TaxID=459 RepID=UPI0039E3814B